ncbi:MAG: PIN domain-containing protein [Pseudomonadota bacterium]
MKLRVAFDTSVLVAGLVEGHPAFPLAALWLDAADGGEIEALWTTHAFAEIWSVLTRLPTAARIEVAAVNRLLADLAGQVEPTALSLEDYTAAAERCAAAGVRSGAIFDALHLVVAERAGAEALLTLNVKDFARLAPRLPVLEPPPTLCLPRVGP